jgi:hypothetical protein
MKNLIILSSFLALIISPKAYCTTYTTVASGFNWNASQSWDANGVPSDNLIAGDVVVINHDVILNRNLELLGKMTINMGASLIGTLKNIKVGKGGTNQGELINIGTISVKDLKSEPDGCSTASDAYPVVHNYGTINATKVDVGKGCGSGKLYNYDDPNGLGSGVINVSEELHIDGEIYNENIITVGSLLKVHGGTIDGCGYIDTPAIKLEANNGSGFGARPGQIDCQDICNASGSEPQIEIKNQGIVSVSVALQNLDQASSILSINVTFCSPRLLPISLIRFDAFANHERDIVQILWETGMEINNDYFSIERSQNGLDWESIDRVIGAGESSEPLKYEAIDSNPIGKISYYRLKQVDFDGKRTYSDIQSVNVGKLRIESMVGVYVNNITKELVIESTQHIQSVYIINVSGQILKQATTAPIQTIDISDLPVGLYIANCASDKSVTSKQFVKR